MVREKLELCLSASVYFFHLLYHSPGVFETLVRRKTKEKSYYISVLQQSYCFSLEPVQSLRLGHTAHDKPLGRQMCLVLIGHKTEKGNTV